jgi:hypothetical protein
VPSSYETYEVTVKKVENKIVYYKETVERRYLIFWPGNQRRVHRHTAEPDSNQRVPVGRVPLVKRDVQFYVTRQFVSLSAVFIECSNYEFPFQLKVKYNADEN